LDGTDDAGVGSAPADVVVERSPDFFFRGFAVLLEEGCRLHDHAVDTVAALHRLFLDEGGLDRMGVLRCTQTFEGGDFRGRIQRADADRARTGRTAVNQHRAGAALPHSATEPRALETKVVSE